MATEHEETVRIPGPAQGALPGGGLCGGRDRGVSGPRVSRSSAELAYYLLLTLFPLLIMVISAVGWLPLESEMVTAFLKTIVPPSLSS